MKTNNNNEITLEHVPFTLEPNQFYCYNAKNGKIYIGEIVGKSAISNRTMYNVNGATYNYIASFTEETPTLRLAKDLKCFKNYQDFLEDYNNYLDSKIKKRKTCKTRYVVNKEIFSCKMTRAAFTPYNTKEFNTKEEAINYANKGIALLEKKSAKYEIELIELKDKLLSIENNIKEYKGDDIDIIRNMIVTPKNISEKDFLTRIAYKTCETTSFPHVEKNYMAVVAKFITPDIVKLSDGTLLLKSECDRTYVSYPMLIKLQDADTAKDVLKRMSIKKLLKDIEYKLDDITKLKKYIKHFEPFKENPVSGIWFSDDYTRKFIGDIKTFLNET